MPIFVTPMEPGRCRILFQIRYPDGPKVNKFIKFMLRVRPEWVNHFFSSEVRIIFPPPCFFGLFSFFLSFFRSPFFSFFISYR